MKKCVVFVFLATVSLPIFASVGGGMAGPLSLVLDWWQRTSRTIIKYSNRLPETLATRKYGAALMCLQEAKMSGTIQFKPEHLLMLLKIPGVQRKTVQAVHERILRDYPAFCITAKHFEQLNATCDADNTEVNTYIYVRISPEERMRYLARGKNGQDSGDEESENVLSESELSESGGDEESDDQE